MNIYEAQAAYDRAEADYESSWSNQWEKHLGKEIEPSPPMSDKKIAYYVYKALMSYLSQDYPDDTLADLVADEYVIPDNDEDFGFRSLTKKEVEKAMNVFEDLEYE